MHIYQNKCCTRIHLQTLVNNSLWREGKYMQNHIPKMKSARPVRIILNWLSNEILKIVNWLHPLFLCAVVKCVPVLYRQLIQQHWLARISSREQVYTYFFSTQPTLFHRLFFSFLLRNFSLNNLFSQQNKKVPSLQSRRSSRVPFSPVKLLFGCVSINKGIKVGIDL